MQNGHRWSNEQPHEQQETRLQVSDSHRWRALEVAPLAVASAAPAPTPAPAPPTAAAATRNPFAPPRQPPSISDLFSNLVAAGGLNTANMEVAEAEDEEAVYPEVEELEQCKMEEYDRVAASVQRLKQLTCKLQDIPAGVQLSDAESRQAVKAAARVWHWTGQQARHWREECIDVHARRQLSLTHKRACGRHGAVKAGG